MDKIKNGLKITSIGLLSIIVFLLPIYQKILSPFIALWAISSILYLVLIKPKIKFNKSTIFILLLYLYLIIGLLWTDNMNSGVFDLEVKMSLVIFPLLLTFLQYSTKLIKWVIYAFVLGLIVGSLYLLYGSTLKFLIWPSYTYYFYIELSPYLHPTYLSVYFVTAIGILLADLYRIKPIFFKRKWLGIVLVIYLFIFNVLLLSKIGIISALLFVLIYLTVWSIKNKKYISLILTILILSTLFYKTYEKSSYFNQRVNELGNGVTTDNETGSTSIRLKIWEQSIKLIKEKPIFGHGTGDVKDVLTEKYKQSQMDLAFKKGLNAHNQFVQVTISLGLLGFFIFILLLYESIKNGLKHKNFYITNFTLIFVMFFLTESMLENQAGTIFFGLFFSLLSQKSLYKE